MKRTSVHQALSHHYYRLGLTAAKQRYLTVALKYAECAFLMDPENADASALAEICRNELGCALTSEQIPEQVITLIQQKNWLEAARVLEKVSQQSVRLLSVQGCLWALLNRWVLSADYFARVLEKDRGNQLALEVLTQFI
jgi:hypothetical protein